MKLSNNLKNQKQTIGKVKNIGKKRNQRIYFKQTWGFWFFKKYLFFVEDKDEFLTEVPVSKEVFQKYDVGDSIRL